MSIEEDIIGKKIILYRGENVDSYLKKWGRRVPYICLSTDVNVAAAYANKVKINTDEVKEEYVTVSPNEARSVVDVVSVDMSKYNPFFCDCDPFFYLNSMKKLKHVTREDIVALAYRHKDLIYETDYWREEISITPFPNITELLLSGETAYDTFTSLYMQFYPLLNDVDFVDMLKSHGYDSVIYRGSGIGAFSYEVVFLDPELMGKGIIDYSMINRYTEENRSEIDDIIKLNGVTEVKW